MFSWTFPINKYFYALEVHTFRLLGSIPCRIFSCPQMMVRHNKIKITKGYCIRNYSPSSFSFLEWERKQGYSIQKLSACVISQNNAGHCEEMPNRKWKNVAQIVTFVVYMSRGYSRDQIWISEGM